MIQLSEKQWTSVFIVGGCAVIFVILLLWWAFSDHGRTEKERKLDTNIGIDAGKNAVLSNLVTNQQQEVNNAQKNTNEALHDLGNSVNRDSSTFDGNRAGDRFCRDFPTDSSCQK